MNSEISSKLTSSEVARSPRIGRTYRHTDLKGKVTEGKIVSIAKIQGRIVLAFFADGKAKPVTKHGVWEELNPDTKLTLFEQKALEHQDALDDLKAMEDLDPGFGWQS